MSQVTLTSREENTVNFTISVPAEKVDSALRKVYQQIAASNRIDGFRKGKAPKEVLNTLFGADSIAAQALQDLLPDVYFEAVEELNLTPIGQPDFDPFPTLEEGKDMEVIVKIDVLPEIHLSDISSINIDLEKNLSAEADEIEDAVKSMRKRLAEFTDVDRPAKENDRVTIDYRITIVDIAGKEPEKEYDARQGLNLIIGDGEILPDIETNLIGLKTGEKKKFVVNYPEEYQNAEIAGKSTSVEVTVHKVSERLLPDIDEAFFKKIGSKAANEEEFRKELEGRIIEYKNSQRQNEIRDAVVEKVVEQTHIDLPEKLVEEELEERRAYFEDLLEQNSLSFEGFLENEGITQEEFDSRENAAAKTDVKRRIVLNEIFAREKMEITSDEMNIALNNYARMHRLRASDLKKIIRDRDKMDRIRSQIRNAKVVSLLVSRAKFKEDWADGAAPAEEQKPAEGETKE